MREKCEKAKMIKKRVTSVKFTEETYQKSKLEVKMNTDEYKELSNHRAGIEGTMSVLRRKYHVDNCPSRGLLRLKLKLGGDILSINIQKGIKYQRNKEEYTDNCSLYEKISQFMRIFFHIEVCSHSF